MKKLHNVNPKILRATARKLVTRATWRHGVLHPCTGAFCVLLRAYLKIFSTCFYRENKSRFFYTFPLLLPLFVYGPIFSRGRYVEVHLVESTNLESQSVNDKVLAPVPFS